MITNPDLARLAESMGVRLVRHDGGPKGLYLDHLRLISTRRGLSIAEYRSTLAHELAHAHYRDVPCRDPVRHARQERRADKWAARLLLDGVDVRSTLAWHNHHRAPAAHDLEVTIHLLDTYIDMARDGLPIT
ncbi:ImmA/IrrE family metallo-endopeptidase [Corynebacterium sanguinis]|uniref:ImmA/IrrE family metallo-endopeptidase n=1 Tax=Corynebacterium sanguinis TaxID=2594913 RepID=UPI0021A90DA7|nr:ImmA/IrrE family metallo-endopeptidase [Corynebacterium sanguinis]MCT1411691.1 ImmA/IrrE family metallo-endopeptidase [Corynebacterium sanguinis]